MNNAPAAVFVRRLLPHKKNTASAIPTTKTETRTPIRTLLVRSAAAAACTSATVVAPPVEVGRALRKLVVILPRESVVVTKPTDVAVASERRDEREDARITETAVPDSVRV